MADIATFRESRPDAAASIAPQLAEYERALGLIAGVITPAARRSLSGARSG